MSYTDKDFKFHHPFTAQIAGPTGSGKTVLLRKILEDWKKVIDIEVKQIKVLWCHGISQAIHTKEIKNVKISYFEGFPSVDYIMKNRPNLIVIDDLMNELGGNKNLANLFTRVSHHSNISVIFIVQNAFHQDKQMRNISLNSHYAILMNNKRDKSQIFTFARQICPSNPKSFMDAYEDAVSVKYGYILVDSHPITPDEISWRTNITRVLCGKLAPTIYFRERKACLTSKNN